MQVKCAHPKCMCAVQQNQSYCSEWCAESTRDQAPPCGCGHPICEQIYKR
jgi:hypothetical protein